MCILQATCTAKKEIKDNMKIADIINEYEMLRTDESNGVNLGVSRRTGVNNEANANALSVARQKVFKKQTGMRNTIHNNWSY